MRRKKTNLILCSLILIASLLAEIYCFLEFRKDILIILGTSIIVLVAAFITLDSFFSIFVGENGTDTGSEEFKMMQKHLLEIEKVQKAAFVMLKKNAMKEQDIMKKFAEQMEQQKDIMVKTGKLIAKYDRENSLRLEELLRKIAERPDFDDTGLLLSLGTSNQSLEKLITDFEKLEKNLENISAAAPSMTLAEETILQTADHLAEETAEQEAAPAEEVVSEPAPELESAPEIDTSDPNKMMSPDDIASLLASMGEEAPAEEVVSEPTPELEPAPEIDTSDPNKMMSPDDIASLLASMGQ